MRNQPVIPEDLQHGGNGRVLAYLIGKSAHSDIIFPLVSAARDFDDVELYCSDSDNVGHVFACAGSTILGFDVGMDGVGLKLCPDLASVAIGAGAVAIPEIGTDWICFSLFGPGRSGSTVDCRVAQAHKIAGVHTNYNQPVARLR